MKSEDGYINVQCPVQDCLRKFEIYTEIIDKNQEVLAEVSR